MISGNSSSFMIQKKVVEELISYLFDNYQQKTSIWNCYQISAALAFFQSLVLSEKNKNTEKFPFQKQISCSLIEIFQNFKNFKTDHLKNVFLYHFFILLINLSNFDVFDVDSFRVYILQYDQQVIENYPLLLSTVILSRENSFSFSDFSQIELISLQQEKHHKNKYPLVFFPHRNLFNQFFDLPVLTENHEKIYEKIACFFHPSYFTFNQTTEEEKQNFYYFFQILKSKFSLKSQHENGITFIRNSIFLFEDTKRYDFILILIFYLIESLKEINISSSPSFSNENQSSNDQNSSFSVFKKYPLLFLLNHLLIKYQPIFYLFDKVSNLSEALFQALFLIFF